MNINPDYVRSAHRLSVWAELQRLLVDRYMQTEQPPREHIICEDVPLSQKHVSQEALFEVLNSLEELQQEERLEMSQFEMRKRHVRQQNRQACPYIPGQTTSCGGAHDAEPADARESGEAGSASGADG